MAETPASERSRKGFPKSTEIRVPPGLLGGSEVVLFVDDEEMICDIGEQILKAMGYRTMIARNGREAVEIYKENQEKIDMVILDIFMPKMGGGEAFDRMKEVNPNVKVLISSGCSVNDQVMDIIGRGCTGFIQKPFRFKDLSYKMREVLDRK
jgi:two-component system cell cycle sensor histidine kinase/response regulator CckA